MKKTTADSLIVIYNHIIVHANNLVSSPLKHIGPRMHLDLYEMYMGCT